MSGDAVMRQLQHGDRDGAVWRPGETDVSIRPGWFYHPAEDDRVRSADNLVDLYFTSVGRNSKLLLNVPPTRDGLLHDTDVARLRSMRERLDAMFEEDLASGRNAAWSATGPRGAVAEADLGRTVEVGIAALGEDITRGQRAARYTLEGWVDGQWRALSEGTTIGYRKLDRFAPATIQRVRLTVHDAVEEPSPVSVRLYRPPPA